MTLSRRGFLELSGSGTLSATLGLSACGRESGAGAESDGIDGSDGSPPVIDGSVPLASPDRGPEAVNGPPRHCGRLGDFVRFCANCHNRTF